MKPEIDPHSGQETTGHEWNGIKELNHPHPARLFRFGCGASILCAAILWVLYPSFSLDIIRCLAACLGIPRAGPSMMR